MREQWELAPDDDPEGWAKAMDKKQLAALVKLLRAKAEDMAKRSEGNDNRKGWWQAGKADAYAWAAEHIEQIIGGM